MERKWVTKFQVIGHFDMKSSKEIFLIFAQNSANEKKIDTNFCVSLIALHRCGRPKRVTRKMKKRHFKKVQILPNEISLTLLDDSHNEHLIQISKKVLKHVYSSIRIIKGVKHTRVLIFKVEIDRKLKLSVSEGSVQAKNVTHQSPALDPLGSLACSKVFGLRFFL